MRFTDIDINFDVRYEGHQNCLKILSMNILSVFSDHYLWRQNWRQYLWTSLCQFNFFVNLLHSLGVSFFDIWHLFDNLTSFWQLDIFLIFWEQITHGPPFPMWLIPLYPIAHVSHCPHSPYPLYPIPHVPLLPMCPIPRYPIPPVGLIAHMPHTPVSHVTHCLCGPYSLYPIAHRLHTPVPHCTYPLYPIPSVALLPMCPYCPCAPYPLCPHCP